MSTMSQIGKTVLSTLRLERNAFGWLDVNDRATGDALIIVVVTRLLLTLGIGWRLFGVSSASFGALEVLVASLVGAAIFWLGFSGAVWAVLRFGFQLDPGFPLLLRAAGFGYPTVLIGIAAIRLGLPVFLVVVVTYAWLFLIMVRVVQYDTEASQERAAAAVIGGFVLWVIIASILGRGYL